MRAITQLPRFAAILMLLAAPWWVGLFASLPTLQDLSTALLTVALLAGFASWCVLRDEFIEWLRSPVRKEKSYG